MTDIASCDSAVKPGSKPFDLESITRQTEQGNTKLLESSLNCASSFSERADVLTAIQGLNAQHRLQEPDKNLPVLSLEVKGVGPLNSITQLSLNTQEYKSFATPQPLYKEHDWSTYSGAHRVVVKDSNKR